MVSDKCYFERRAAEESARAAGAESVEAKQWHRALADKFTRLASEVEDPTFEQVVQPLSTRRERRAAHG
jgi:hypothetical protein